ncbi:dTDP-4-dehydrorhamnose reductase [Vagococcus acidifermentans]|uniref:dTDP-4-dehydrorhamnose reductase n=1 Tax=Vagococcus acidifermentans TaxID=564710 RepID=UPI000F85FEE7|nr:dTDP-4-dehydrorhamnose reductase [Vagococcus acidifermentans]
MKILITGANGQLGKELQKLLNERRVPFDAAAKDTLNITDQQAVMAYFKDKQPDWVFHCAAYTAVDAAEDEGKDLNYLINATGTAHIAQACQLTGAVLVYVSTDYVFDGTKKTAEYRVDDATNPLNEYGKAKLLGEQAVRENCEKYYIVRTSWVFGEFGKNFVFTMKRLAETHESLTVVHDQFGRPTWTRSLAEFLVFLMTERPTYGTYHFSNDDSCSWYEFAREILKDEKVIVKPVDSSQFPQKAARPQYSVMDLSKVKELGFKIETWREALGKFLVSLHH